MKRAIAILACLALAACAGILGFTRGAPQAFPHRAHVVAGVACTQCHAGMGSNATALHLPDAASCTSCHAKPHDAHPCLTCHAAPTAIAALVEARDHLVFDHAPHMAPTQGNCARCHVGIADGDDHLRPPMATCFKCHDHDAARDARRCDACHRGLEDTKLLPETHLAHDGNWLREHGTRAASSGDLCQSCHKERFCAECHGANVAVLPATMHFADPFAPSVHRAGFRARHALEARAEPGACATCHTPDRCAACHLAQGVAGPGRRSPHPPGWVGLGAAGNQHGRDARRDPAACAACHDGAGQALCIGCHKVGGIGGSPHPAGWSSRLPLTALPCRLCHAIGARR
jgi:Cytochrome c7 and related cytochrome c